MKFYSALFLLFVALTTSLKSAMANPAKPDQHQDEDPYLWLEEIDSSSAMTWVKNQNQDSLGALQSDPRYPLIEKQMREIILAHDRTPFGSYRAGYVYNFWQDEEHVRGLWRRTLLNEYKKASPQWEILLDLDALNVREGKNWVYKGTNCLAPTYERCLLSLSPGGKDAAVIREFNITTKEFVVDGFQVPEAKSEVAWVDEDTILIGTHFGPDTVTQSGYPFVVKSWKRGQPLSEAQEIFRGAREDVGLSVSSDLTSEKHWVTISRNLSFFESEIWLWSSSDGLQKLPLPTRAEFNGIFQGRALAILREDWNPGTRHLPKGALISLAIGQDPSTAEIVFEPTKKMSIQSVSWTHDALYLTILDNVRGKAFRGTHAGLGWQLTPFSFPNQGVIGIQSVDPLGDQVFFTYQDFITPTTLYSVNVEAGKSTAFPQVIKQEPRRFDPSDLEIAQKEATSKDGTKIPYFIIRKNGTELDGSHPTLLYGYGGFEISQTPFYLSTWGKVWLEKGGVVAIANIRGGGEFGPAWHQAATKENHQTTFDDFIASAEDLIKTGITSPKHLGIMGGSNGGLLVGATYVQRPDLFKAVVCQVPLLDMLRYHHLLAGASWMDEYGNPDDPAMRPYIEKYSPYQNLKKDQHYPTVFFTTSTRDDRVHPGHARKMAAKMEAYGHPFKYFENINGGHGGAADLEEKILVNSMTFTFLFQQLF